jgi:hypothetical protein
LAPAILAGRLRVRAAKRNQAGALVCWLR